MKKAIILLSIMLVFISCTKQKTIEVEKQTELENQIEKEAPSLQRKSVLQEYLDESSDKYTYIKKPKFGEDSLPEPLYELNEITNNKQYVAFICKANADVKKEPNFESETIRRLNYSDSFRINQSWYSKNYEGFWCYNDYYNGWIYSKDLNIENDINISVLSTEGMIEENEYEYLKIKINRFGKETEDSELQVRLFENESNKKTFSLNTDINGANCFDSFGFYIYNPDTKVIIPDCVLYLFIKEKRISEEENILHITDDNKYILIDSGTSPGIRGLSVFDLTKNEYIFKGSYYRYDFLYNENDVIVLTSLESFKDIDGFTKENLKAEIQKYEENNPLSEEETEKISSGFTCKNYGFFKYNYRINTYEYLYCQRIITQ